MRYSQGVNPLKYEQFKQRINDLDLARNTNKVINNNLLFFDNLNSNNNIADGSTGYEIDSINGGISKTLANNYEYAKSPLPPDGALSNTIFEDGALIKDYVVKAAPSIFQDLSVASDITSVDSTSEQILGSPNIVKWYGSYTTNTSTNLQLAVNLDATGYNLIKIPIWTKSIIGKVYYYIEVEDGAGAKWQGVQDTINENINYINLEVYINDLSGAIDVSTIKFIRIFFIRNPNDEIIMENLEEDRDADIVENLDIRQNFTAQTDAEISYIRIKAKKDKNTSANLYVGLGTPVGSIISYGILKPGDATKTSTDYKLKLSSPFSIINGFDYSIIFKSSAVDKRNYRWKVRYKRNLLYWGDSFNYQANSSINGTLYTAPPNFEVYVKPLSIEGESSWVPAGDYISSIINLGQNMISISNLSMSYTGNVKIYMRTSDSAVNILSVGWTDVTGGINLGTLTLYSNGTYLQYKIVLDEGNTINTTSTPKVYSIYFNYSTGEPPQATVVFKTIYFDKEANYIYFAPVFNNNYGSTNLEVYVDDNLTGLNQNEIVEISANRIYIKAVLTGDAVLKSIGIVSDTTIKEII